MQLFLIIFLIRPARVHQFACGVQCARSKQASTRQCDARFAAERLIVVHMLHE
jgi:hypothetical protein